MGPLKSQRIYPIPQVGIKHLSQRPKFSCVSTHHYCAVTCDLKLFIPGPMTKTKHLYFHLCQLKSGQFFVVLFLSPLPKAEHRLSQQAGIQTSHQYSETKDVQFVAWYM